MLVKVRISLKSVCGGVGGEKNEFQGTGDMTFLDLGASYIGMFHL